MLPAAIVVLLAVFISQSDAFCFASRSMSKDCVYKGHTIANGAVSKFNDECLECGCNDGFLHCCSIGMRITSYPSYCKVIPDGPCHQKVVMINDDKKPCTGPIAAVGR